MTESVDIQNLLQTGYFTTSRHKDGQRLSPGHSPSPLSRSAPTQPIFEPQQRPSNSNPPPRRAYPPAPRVDDEDFILAREHGTAKLVPPEEDANSRGDVDQNPVIMDVHEFNPERRFVIIENEAKPGESSGEGKVNGQREEDTKPASAEPREQSKDRRHLKPESASAFLSQARRPVFERRRSSRQDLPTIDTELGDRRDPEHHRSKSAVNGPRPDYFSPRKARQFGDSLLSPEMNNHGLNGREQSYCVPADRDAYSSRDRPRDSRSAGTARRSSPNMDQGEFRRPVSNDRARTGRTRGDAAYTSYDTGRSSRYTCSDDSHPKGEGRRSPSFQKPIITQNGRAPEAPDHIANERLQRHRSPSRSNTTPIPASTKMPAPEKMHSDPKTAPRKPSRSETTSGVPLPYPEEDGFKSGGSARGGANNGSAPFVPVLMPEVPNVAPEVVVSPTAASTSSPPATPASQRNTWKPQSFDPERDGVQLERPVGIYRRYSENRDKGQGQELPECPRIKPVSGKMDWLTLPRSNFNICPDCYGSVFADTEYRTHFQPMLRPTTEALSCDFGSSPWYRIAWLLILKQQAADLRMFHEMAHLMHVAKDTPCPEYRKSTRTWYTVKDPTSRKPVPEFTVCYQCAKTVEILLPNLAGVFVPLDSKSEPSKSTCALHFAPDRREFVLFFDAFETTAERAAANKRTANVSDLTKSLGRLTTHNACREDRPVSEGYWHYMQYLPQFTVCGDCFEDVVKPL